MEVIWRKYQSESIHGGSGYPGIFKALKDHQSTLLVLPTGTGKTIVFSEVVEACYVKKHRKAMIIAHREELINQAYDKLLSTTSIDSWDIGVEMAGNHAADHHGVVIGSIQTLTQKRLEKFRPEDFGLIVIDECHHAVADSYDRIFKHFSGSKHLGVTATPDRMDGKGLGKVFNSVAYVYEISSAIADGWLVDITGEVIYDESSLDLSQVRTTAGDLNLGDLGTVMTSPKALALVAKGVVEKSMGRPTMIFATQVDHAEALSETINMIEPGSCVWVDGKTEKNERESALSKLASGEVKRVVNCMLYTEGVDVPEVSCIAIARPTKSRSLYAQMVGRGTRLLGSTLEESIARGKSDCHILDFSGASGKHRLVSCLDVLDSSEDAQVRAAAMERVQSGRVSIRVALDEAAVQIAQEERAKALKDIRYRTEVMSNPFTILGIRPRPGMAGGAPGHRSTAATARQA